MPGSPFEFANMSLPAPCSKQVAVIGRVGSGKTSRLHGILGEFEMPSGSVALHGSVAYVPQQP
ncbi:hypothetical protein BC828DRAFT_409224 [Blastocladiella britannica]|nr:hypothetical protein BC828DRAFT_409224 [Blastocladiella britannica]